MNDTADDDDVDGADFVVECTDALNAGRVITKEEYTSFLASYCKTHPGSTVTCSSYDDENQFTTFPDLPMALQLAFMYYLEEDMKNSNAIDDASERVFNLCISTWQFMDLSEMVDDETLQDFQDSMSTYAPTASPPLPIAGEGEEEVVVDPPVTPPPAPEQSPPSLRSSSIDQQATENQDRFMSVGAIVAVALVAVLIVFLSAIRVRHRTRNRQQQQENKVQKDFLDGNDDRAMDREESVHSDKDNPDEMMIIAPSSTSSSESRKSLNHRDEEATMSSGSVPVLRLPDRNKYGGIIIDSSSSGKNRRGFGSIVVYSPAIEQSTKSPTFNGYPTPLQSSIPSAENISQDNPVNVRKRFPSATKKDDKSCPTNDCCFCHVNLTTNYSEEEDYTATHHEEGESGVKLVNNTAPIGEPVQPLIIRPLSKIVIPQKNNTLHIPTTYEEELTSAADYKSPLSETMSWGNHDDDNRYGSNGGDPSPS